MSLDNLNIFVLSENQSAPKTLRENLEVLGGSLGLYHSYSQLREVLAENPEACVVIDLLKDHKLLFHWDFSYFYSQANAHSMAQLLRWKINTGEPMVDIDKNFRIINEDIRSSEEVRDGLERLPVYYFSPGVALDYVMADQIRFKGEEWIGLPLGYPRQRINFQKKKPALFLDRDGVVNEDFGYVSKYENIKFKEEIFPIIKMFNDRDFPVFILTNQSGIAKDMYSEDDVIKLHEKMDEYLTAKGLKITEWVYSPYHHEGSVEKFKRLSFTRKPGSGMAMQILERHSVDLESSIMIGDKVSDEIFVPGLSCVLLKGNYPLEDSHSLSFDSLNEIENFLKERI